MSRLEATAPEIADLLDGASPSMLRRLAAAVATYAIERADAHDGRIDSALVELQRGACDEETRRRLSDLVVELDDRQWKVGVHMREGMASRAEHLAVFSKARAVAALISALEPDPRHAAMEATYEALAAVDDRAAIHSLLEQRLHELDQ